MSFAGSRESGRESHKSKAEHHCHESLKHSSLPSHQLQGLCGAAQVLDIVLLETPKKQKIIILGENHVMNRSEQKVGDELLKHFPLRGLEGYNGAFKENSASSIAYSLALYTADIGLFGTSNIKRARAQGLYHWTNGNQVKVYKDSSEIKAETNYLELTKAYLKTSPSTPLNIGLERSLVIRKEVERHCPDSLTCRAGRFNQFMIERRNDDMANTISNIIPLLNQDRSFLVIVGTDHVKGLIQRLTSRHTLKSTIAASPLMVN